MKLSLSQMALVAVLTLSTGHMLAWRDCTGTAPVVGRACPCNKPKPKPKQPVAPKASEAKKEAEAKRSVDCSTTERCPCNKPKPKPKQNTNKVAQYVETFRSSTPAQQRDQLVAQVKQYVSNPNDTTAQMLTECAQAYCDRVKNPALNKLVKELLSSNDKKTVQASIMRTLEVR